MNFAQKLYLASFLHDRFKTKTTCKDFAVKKEDNTIGFTVCQKEEPDAVPLEGTWLSWDAKDTEEFIKINLKTLYKDIEQKVRL